MLEFLSVIKIIAIVQMVIMILLVIFAYGVKVYTYHKNARVKKITKKVEQYLMEWMERPTDFNPAVILPYKPYVELIISIINKFDVSLTVEKWKVTREKLMTQIVLPGMRLYANSPSWSKRYLVCQAYQLSLEHLDDDIVKSLINDPIPLVSINAAILATKSNSQMLIDTVIDCFSKGRRIQQSLYAQILSSAVETMIPLVKHRLRHEKKPYVKIFCYRTLTQIPYVSETIETAFVDLNSNHLDLKLAVLDYLRKNDPQASFPRFVNLLKDNHWQVRARAAKLLGDMGNDFFASALEESLKDSVWWVRINAADALAKLGFKGILILQRQKPEIDQYAYDTARQVLSITIAVKDER